MVFSGGLKEAKLQIWCILSLSWDGLAQQMANNYIINNMMRGPSIRQQQYLTIKSRQAENERNKQGGSEYRRPHQLHQYKQGLEVLNLSNLEGQYKNVQQATKQLRSTLKKNGDEFVNNSEKRLAVVLLCGGLSQRFDFESKEFQTIQISKDRQTTLFMKTIQTIEKCYLQFNCEMYLYIICNNKNSSKILDYIQGSLKLKYPAFPVYICHQYEQPLLDWHGMQNIFIKGTKDKLTYPAGIGAFSKATIQYGFEEKYSLKDHLLDLIDPTIVYCMGCADFDQTGINLEMIGLLLQQQLDCVFECSQFQGKKEELSLLCVSQIRQSLPAWLVIECCVFRQFFPKDKNYLNFVVWKDNFVFVPKILRQSYKYNPSEIQYQPIHKKLKSKNNSKEILTCYVMEQTISYSLLRNKQKCMGYMTQIGSPIKQREDINKIKVQLEDQPKNQKMSKAAKKQN